MVRAATVQIIMDYKKTALEKIKAKVFGLAQGR